jgi:two-component system sensor histidine kinase VicK
MMVDQLYQHWAPKIVLDLAAKNPGSVVFHRPANELIYVSPDVSQLTGIETTSSLRKINSLIQHLPEDDQALLIHQWHALQYGTNFVEFEVIWNHEGIRTLCISAFQILDGDYTIAFVKDMTAAKAHQNYLVEFGAKKNTTLDSVLHFVSGALSLTQQFYVEAGKNLERSNTENLKDLLELINQNNQHCLEVISRVVGDEYDKSPSVAAQHSHINVVEHIQYIVQNLKLAYPERRFDFVHNNEPVVLDTDEFKLLQIINNLVFNSIKFSKTHEPVVIRVSKDEDAVLISVKDNGIGIPPELQSYVFDRNTIAGRIGLKGETSHGIGLSICKQLATQMGGRIWFETQPEAGSTFYLSLPRINAQPGPIL